jgi:hypothetical protein
MLIKSARIDKSARILNVPAVAPTDRFQRGVTRTHDAFASVGVPTIEAIHCYEGHETGHSSVRRVPGLRKRGAAKPISQIITRERSKMGLESSAVTGWIQGNYGRREHLPRIAEVFGSPHERIHAAAAAQQTMVTTKNQSKRKFPSSTSLFA